VLLIKNVFFKEHRDDPLVSCIGTFLYLVLFPHLPFAVSLLTILATGATHSRSVKELSLQLYL